MTVVPPNVDELDNAALAQLLDDEARFRPVYNGDMAPVMREAAKRVRLLDGRDAFICSNGLWRRFVSWVGTPEANGVIARFLSLASEPAKAPELCSHCKRPVADADCPFDTCPAGIEF